VAHRTPHGHDADNATVSARIELKAVPRTTQSTQGQLLADQVPELSVEVSVAMGATDSIKCALRHEKPLGLSPNPTLLQSLVVPDEWKTSDGTNPGPFLVACWITDQYHPCSNLRVGISEGCFIFHFASLLLEVARPI